MSTIISIIIPCYNHASYVKECLDSVLAQNYLNWECILVNDGSTDHSHAQIKQWLQENPDTRFTYFNNENRGVVATRNFAAAKAIGKYLLPLDSDDYLSNNYVASCVHHLEQHPKCDLVYGRTQFFGAMHGQRTMVPFSYSRLIQGNFIHCSAAFSKERFVQIGGYDSIMQDGLEDWELYVNMLDANSDVHILQEAWLYYRIKEISRNEVIDSSKLNKLRLVVLQKHLEKYVFTFGNYQEMLTKINQPIPVDDTIIKMYRKFKKQITRVLKKLLRLIKKA